MYIVYKRATPDGKVYIGKTSRTLSQRAGKDGISYKGCTRFYNAILKYGWGNIESEVLFKTEDARLARKMETYYICEYDSANPNKGYNIVGRIEYSGKQIPWEEYFKIKEWIFAKNLVSLRKEKGFSRMKLSQVSDINFSRLSKFEHATCYPNPCEKIAIAMALHVKPSALDDDREED